MRDFLTNKDFLLLINFILNCETLTSKVYFRYELIQPTEIILLTDSYTVLIEDIGFTTTEKVNIELNIKEVIDKLNLAIAKEYLLANLSTYKEQEPEPFSYIWDKKDTLKFFSYLSEVEPADFPAIINMHLKGSK